jgi:tetratricopeptide (TPR) repeat protein
MLSGPRIVKALLAAIIVGYLGWCCVRAAVSGQYANSNPFVAIRADPNDPEARFAVAMIEVSLRNGRVDAKTRRAALSGLVRAPLAEEPFFLSGLAMAAEGRDNEAQALFAEAVRRNPRFRAARLLLLNHYLQSGDVDQAGIEMAALNRLIPRASDVLINQVADMVRDPARGAALMRVLRANPAMQQNILSRLASTGADPALILRIASAVSSSIHAEGSEWQRLLVSRLVERGRLYQAHQLWLGFNGLQGEPGVKSIYDGDFSGKRGQAPFGWTLASGAAGVAEITKSGLQVDYYGREAADLASQVLLLRPGRYRLQFTAEGDASGEGSTLNWVIACLGNKHVILDHPLAKVGSARRTVGVGFAVPAGCAGQSLTLNGRPDEFPTEQSVLISAWAQRRHI